MFIKPPLILLALAPLATLACASDANGSEETALKIASFGASTMQVTERSSVALTAIVSDQEAPADIQAGALVDPMSGGTYGAFAATSTPGTFAIQVTWDQFNAMEPIDAPPVDGKPRDVRADFFDASGHVAHATARVTVRCESDLNFARHGSCDPWFHSECGTGWCGVTNYTDAIRTGNQMCPIAVHDSTCTACSTSDGTMLGCSTPLPILANCECH